MNNANLNNAAANLLAQNDNSLAKLILQSQNLAPVTDTTIVTAYQAPPRPVGLITPKTPPRATGS